MKARIHQIIAAISSFAPSLTARVLSLTALVQGIKREAIIAINIAPAVTGVNAKLTTTGSLTPVVGTTYYLTVETNENISGRRTNHVFQATAATATYTDLVDLLVTQVTNRPDAPFTAAKVSSHLELTEAPANSNTAAIAGDVRISANINTSAGLFAAVATVTTAHVNPVGQPAQLTRNSAGQRLVGTISSSTVYTTIAVTSVGANGEPVQDILYVDEALAAGSENYIVDTCKQYAALIGLSEGAVLTVVASVTSPDATAAIPLGIKQVLVSSANAGYFVGLPTDAPVGTEISVTTGATTAKVQLPTGESLNGGTAAGSATLTASKQIRLKKTSATTWLGHAFALDGTASDSTTEDQAASA